jgi:hypothetical protein
MRSTVGEVQGRGRRNFLGSDTTLNEWEHAQKTAKCRGALGEALQQRRLTR